MPEYKDTATRLREASKRNDLPTGIVALLSEAYAEIDRLERRLENVRNGFEGCCTTCEPVAILNQKLQRERDEARREVCRIDADTYGSVGLVAERRGWDCYKENTNG